MVAPSGPVEGSRGTVGRWDDSVVTGVVELVGLRPGSPSLVSEPPGATLLTYSRVEGTEGGGVVRVPFVSETTGGPTPVSGHCCLRGSLFRRGLGLEGTRPETSSETRPPQAPCPKGYPGVVESRGPQVWVREVWLGGCVPLGASGVVCLPFWFRVSAVRSRRVGP